MFYVEITDKNKLREFIAREDIAVRDIRVTERVSGDSSTPPYSHPVFHLFYYQNKFHNEKATCADRKSRTKAKKSELPKTFAEEFGDPRNIEAIQEDD